MNTGFGEKAFNYTNASILLFASIITIYPFIRILAISLSRPYALDAFPMAILPRGFTFNMYINMFQREAIMYGFANSIFITVVGCLADTSITVMMAYPLSKKDFPFRSFITLMAVFTMFFNPGIVPIFMNIKRLGLMDKYLALILPRLVYPYYLLIARNFFMSISPEIEESAKMDGANDLIILFRLIIPLSIPVILTILLWTAVFRWNNYLDCIMFISSQNKRVLPVILREMILTGSQGKVKELHGDGMNISQVRSSTIVISMIPVLIAYPFLQRHFVKGIMIGSVKG